MLDGLERFGRAISVTQLLRMGTNVGLIVSGAIGVDAKGRVIGTGSGHFDLVTAALYTSGLLKAQTMTIVIGHGCQIYDDECLYVTDQDIRCDFIVTPNKVLTFEKQKEIAYEIKWNRLDNGKMEQIPLLKELKDKVNR